MAEGIARHWADENGFPEIEFSSAGTLGIVGHPATEEAILVCDEIGVDISGHLSRGLTARYIRDADYIFGMEHAHLEIAKEIEPSASEKIFLLGDYGYAASGKEIPDPLGMGVSYFRLVRDAIRDNIYRILPSIAHEK